MNFVHTFSQQVYDLACEYDGGDDMLQILLKYGSKPEILAPIFIEKCILQDKIYYNMMKSFHAHGLDFNNIFNKIFR